MPRAEWSGSVYLPTGRLRLYLRVRVAGRWRSVPTPYPDTPEGRESAERMLATMRSRLQAEEAAGAVEPELTVDRWAETWLGTRRDPTYDRIHLTIHVLPVLGSMPLRRLEPRHLLELVDTWRAAGAAARTIRNRYATIHAMCRDAAVRGLIPQSPAILSRPAHLPAIEDADPEWRPTAVYQRGEVERLLGAPGPADSHIVWHLLALAGLRHGELAALRWRHYDAEREPLGSLLIARSNLRPRTKTGRARHVPVLPLLASVLAEWRLTGWQRYTGRAPEPDDLVVPLLPTRRHPDLRMRTKGHTLRRLHRALRALGLRERRGHDLRRTWISLCLSDGADRETLRWASHGRPGDVMGLYTELEWQRLCGEVGRLRISPQRARVVPIRRR